MKKLFLVFLLFTFLTIPSFAQVTVTPYMNVFSWIRVDSIHARMMLVDSMYSVLWKADSTNIDTNTFVVSPAVNMVGIGTASPKAPLSIHNATPIMYLVDTDINKNVSSLGEAVDSGSVAISASGTDPYIAIGGVIAAVDQQNPSLVLRGDADSDASATTTEYVSLSLTPAATPTNSTWGFESSQGAGYTFDKAVSVGGTLGVTGAATFNSTITVTDDDWYGLRADGGRMYFDDQTTDELIIQSANIGIGTDTPVSQLHIAKTGIGSTQLEANGIRLSNSTDAAAGAQQYSPPLTFRGNGWKTNATAASQPVEFMAYARPIQGTTAPSGALDFLASINDGSYSATPIMTMLSSGIVGIGTASPATALDIGGGGDITLTGASIVSDGAGALTINTAVNKDLVLDSGTSADGNPILAGNDDYFVIRTAGTVRGGFGGLNNVMSLFGGFTNASHLTISTAGNVGIGTTNPGALLTVNSKSDTLIQAFGDKDGSLWSSADSAGVMQLPTGDVEIGNSNTDAALAVTGIISGKTGITLDTDATIVLTAAMCKNAARFNNDADAIDYTLPAAEAGLVVLFYDIAGGVITIDPVDGTDTIYLNGVSVGAGDAIDSPGAIGDFICLMAIDDTRWITLGQSGVWVDGGAD